MNLLPNLRRLRMSKAEMKKTNEELSKKRIEEIATQCDRDEDACVTVTEEVCMAMEIIQLRARPQSGLSAGDREKIVEAICLIQDECTKGPIKLLYEVLSSAPTEGWISVEDRLPEFGEYLAFNGMMVGTSYYTLHQGWAGPIRAVTHWMPLPEPPLLDRLAGK
jgi:benzoyl-CoA reductase/2-hydroxyglutaryl-CoA dehydratase subunit BcrC/BadD/HgdB